MIDQRVEAVDHAGAGNQPEQADDKDDRRQHLRDQQKLPECVTPGELVAAERIGGRDRHEDGQRR